MWELPTCANVTSHVGDLVSGRIGVIVSLPVPSYNARYYTEGLDRLREISQHKYCTPGSAFIRLVLDPHEVRLQKIDKTYYCDGLGISVLSSLRTGWHRSLRERVVHGMRIDGLTKALPRSGNGCHVGNGDAKKTPLGQVISSEHHICIYPSCVARHVSSLQASNWRAMKPEVYQ